MIMEKEKLIPIVAITILFIGFISSIYTYANQIEGSTIIINGQQYTIDQIFIIAEPRAFDMLNFSGIALDDIILKTGVGCPKCHKYTLVGEDGYQKTVDWENIQNSLLTHKKMVVFSNLPKAFNVKDIVKIEVI